jgi:hypothetical protein
MFEEAAAKGVSSAKRQLEQHTMTSSLAMAKASQRVARGRTHIAAAEAAFAAYSDDEESIALDLSYDSRERGTRARVVIRRSLPNAVSMAISDALQSFRVALDGLWTSLSTSESTDFFVSFPWATNAADAVARLVDDSAVKMMPALKDFIIKRVKPWPDGNPIISGLFQITERDRHGVLDLAFASPRVLAGRLTGVEAGEIDLAGFALPGPNQSKIDWPGKVDISEPAKVVVDLVFGPSQVHAGNKVFDGLKHTHNQVGQIIYEVGQLPNALRVP